MRGKGGMRGKGYDREVTTGMGRRQWAIHEKDN